MIELIRLAKLVSIELCFYADDQLIGLRPASDTGNASQPTASDWPAPVIGTTHLRMEAAASRQCFFSSTQPATQTDADRRSGNQTGLLLTRCLYKQLNNQREPRVLLGRPTENLYRNRTDKNPSVINDL